MHVQANDPEMKIEAQDDGGGWVWVVSECGWPPLTGRTASRRSAERTGAFASGALAALSRIGRRRF